MTVSRPSLRIRRGRWRTRALAASPTAAERTARCSSTGVRRAPKNSSAMARSCSSHCSASSADLGAGARASNSSARRRAVPQVDGNVAKIDLAARGVDGALVHFNAPSWAVRAVMSSTTLPVCPKTGSTSPSLTVHLCLHTAPGNRECARMRRCGGCAVTRMSASACCFRRPPATSGCSCAARPASVRPRACRGGLFRAICRLIGRLIDCWGPLRRLWGFKWTPTALVGSIAHRQAA